MKRVEFWREREEREREKVQRRGTGNKRGFLSESDNGTRLKERRRSQKKKEETEREIEREIERDIEREREVVQQRELALSMGSIEEESVGFSSGGWAWGFEQEFEQEFEEETWSSEETQDEEEEKRAEWLLSNAQFYYSLSDNRHKNYDNYFTDTRDDEDGATRRAKARRKNSVLKGNNLSGETSDFKSLLDAFQDLMVSLTPLQQQKLKRVVDLSREIKAQKEPATATDVISNLAQLFKAHPHPSLTPNPTPAHPPSTPSPVPSRPSSYSPSSNEKPIQNGSLLPGKELTLPSPSIGSWSPRKFKDFVQVPAPQTTSPRLQVPQPKLPPQPQTQSKPASPEKEEPRQKTGKFAADVSSPAPNRPFLTKPLLSCDGGYDIDDSSPLHGEEDKEEEESDESVEEEDDEDDNYDEDGEEIPSPLPSPSPRFSRPEVPPLPLSTSPNRSPPTSPNRSPRSPVPPLALSSNARKVSLSGIQLKPYNGNSSPRSPRSYPLPPSPLCNSSKSSPARPTPSPNSSPRYVSSSPSPSLANIEVEERYDIDLPTSSPSCSTSSSSKSSPRGLPEGYDIDDTTPPTSPSVPPTPPSRPTTFSATPLSTPTTITRTSPPLSSPPFEKQQIKPKLRRVTHSGVGFIRRVQQQQQEIEKATAKQIATSFCECKKPCSPSSSCPSDSSDSAPLPNTPLSSFLVPLSPPSSPLTRFSTSPRDKGVGERGPMQRTSAGRVKSETFHEDAEHTQFTPSPSPSLFPSPSPSPSFPTSSSNTPSSSPFFFPTSNLPIVSPPPLTSLALSEELIKSTAKKQEKGKEREENKEIKKREPKGKEGGFLPKSQTVSSMSDLTGAKVKTSNEGGRAGRPLSWLSSQSISDLSDVSGSTSQQPLRHQSTTVPIPLATPPQPILTPPMPSSSAPSSPASRLINSLKDTSSMSRWGKGYKATSHSESAEMNWNEAYQRLLEMPDNAEKYRGIAQLGLDFVNIAKVYGRVIISERPLPPHMRTIKPVTSSLGGVAGGEKYIVRSILFKFATDVRIRSGVKGDVWMYGGRECSHENAIKSAGQELQGLVAIHNSKVKDLRTPMMALIDFRGYRLIAQSFLPVTTGTLRYGSCDGGNLIRDDDPVLLEKMKSVALELNLAPHTVLSRKERRPVVVWGPGDLEGHNGLDGHHYVLDFGRVMPPAYPHRELTREDAADRIVFFQKLRTEFIRSLPFALSSDAFTVWGRMNNTDHNAKVSMATQYLMNRVIPDFAQKLLKSKTLNIDMILTDLHTRGINFRYLGLVRKHVEKGLGMIPRGRTHTILSVLLQEMIARTEKCLLRREIRKVEMQKITMDEQLKVVTVNHFNLLLCHTEESRMYWKKNLKTQLCKKFQGGLSEEEQHVLYDIKGDVVMHELLKRLADMLGVEIGAPALESIANSPKDARILLSDVGSMSPTIKHMNIIEHAQAMSLWLEMRSLDVESDRFDPVSKPCLSSQVLGHSSISYRAHHVAASIPFCRGRLFEAADSQFARSLRRTPDCVEALCQWGKMLYVQSLRTVGKEADSLCSRSFRLYQTALQLTRYSDRSIVLEFGRCLFERGKRVLGEGGPKWRHILVYAGHCFSYVMRGEEDEEEVEERGEKGEEKEKEKEKEDKEEKEGKEKERKEGEEEEEEGRGSGGRWRRLGKGEGRRVRKTKKGSNKEDQETDPDKKKKKVREKRREKGKDRDRDRDRDRDKDKDKDKEISRHFSTPPTPNSATPPTTPPTPGSSTPPSNSATPPTSPPAPAFRKRTTSCASFRSMNSKNITDASDHHTQFKKHSKREAILASLRAKREREKELEQDPFRRCSDLLENHIKMLETQSLSLKTNKTDLLSLLVVSVGSRRVRPELFIPFWTRPSLSSSAFSYTLSNPSLTPSANSSSPLLLSSPRRSPSSSTLPSPSRSPCASPSRSPSPPAKPWFPGSRPSENSSPTPPPQGTPPPPPPRQSSPPAPPPPTPPPPPPPPPPPELVCMPLLKMLGSEFHQLTSVDFSNFRDTDTDHLLSHLIPFCSSVERLVFRDSAIGFLTLSAVAANCPSLLLLNLQRCSAVTVSSIAEVVSSCPFLETLLIQKTNIDTTELINTLANLFPHGVAPSLKRIHVSRVTKESAQFAKKRFGDDLKIESTGHILDDGPM